MSYKGVEHLLFIRGPLHSTKGYLVDDDNDDDDDNMTDN